MNGKTVVITGASSGIGRETALGLASMGAELLLVCRDPRKAHATSKLIEESTGNSHVRAVIADLLLQTEVRRAASEIESFQTNVDVLVNNAGTEFFGYGETDEGIERTMAVNYFAPYLLTRLLLARLERSANARVVNVSSTAHYSGKLDPGNIAKDRRMGFGGLGAYGRSKLALVLFTYELARRAEGRVTVNCLHPGAVRTNIWARAGPLNPLIRAGTFFMKSAKQGAETPIYLASSSDVEGVTGKYFEDRREKKSSRASYDEGLAKALWEASERITGMQVAVT